MSQTTEILAKSALYRSTFGEHPAVAQVCIDYDLNAHDAKITRLNAAHVSSDDDGVALSPIRGI